MFKEVYFFCLSYFEPCLRHSERTVKLFSMRKFLDSWSWILGFTQDDGERVRMGHIPNRHSERTVKLFSMRKFLDSWSWILGFTQDDGERFRMGHIPSRHSEQSEESRGKNSEIFFLITPLGSGSCIFRFAQDDEGKAQDDLWVCHPGAARNSVISNNAYFLREGRYVV